jgi:hypothetical protein
MASEKKGGRTRHKGSEGRSDRERVGRTVEKAGQDGGGTLVDVDPWGSFVEKFWEQPAEGESVDRHERGRKPAKGTWTPRRKSARQERSPRAS